MQKITAVLFLLMIGFTQMYAQSVQTITPSIPTSPQSEAFKRFGEYAVNYSTGAPDISIPLYEINHHGYKMPLQLKYNPQPLKPSNNYDVYGHGWGLSISSSVSRSIEGSADEASDFKLVSSNLNLYYFTGSNLNPCGDCYDMSSYTHLNPFDYVFIHDKFNTVLPNGTSFEFILDFGYNHQPVATISDGRQVQITCDYGSDNIYGFTIVDEEGVKYTFDGADYPGPYPGNGSRFVSWQLTRIDLPNSLEPIVFSYDQLIVSPYMYAVHESGMVVTDYHKVNPDNYRSTTVTDAPNESWISYTMKLLTAITYGNTSILLKYKYENYGSVFPSYNYVTNIFVNENYSQLKDIKLDMTIHDVLSRTNFKLAKLDSLSILGSEPVAAPQVYRFSYQNLSYYFPGTDHWGNLNDQDTYNEVANFNLFVEADPSLNSSFSVNASMVAKSVEDINPYYKMKLSKSNFDIRKPGGSHGVLTRISYPTGGHTDFEFENHKFLTSTDNDGNYILDAQKRITADGSGFRIRKIANYTKDGVRGDVKNYRYGKTNAEAYPEGHPNHGTAIYYPNEYTGVGIAPVDPNILTYMSYSWDIGSYGPEFIRNMILGLDEFGQYTSFGNYFLSNSVFSWNNWKWEAHFSPLNFRKILNGRPSVLYSDVTVYYGDIDENSSYTPETTIGKTVYKYNITEPNNDLLGRWQDDAFIEAPHYVGNAIDYTPWSHSLNKIGEQIDYKFDGEAYQPVKKEVYAWAARNQSYSQYVYSHSYPASFKPFFITLHDFFSNELKFIGVSLLSSKSTTTYSLGGAELTSHELYTYNSRNQLSETKYQNSAGKWVVKTFNYTKDKTGAIIQKMIEKNIVSPLLETQTLVEQSPSNSVVTSGSKVDYDEYIIGASTLIMPAKSYQLEINPSSSLYVLQGEAKRYSLNGNPLEFISKDGIRSSYIWGYNDRYMIAEVKNAGSNEIYFSDFEQNGWAVTGNFSGYDNTRAHTGNYSGKIENNNASEKVVHADQWLNITLSQPTKFKYSGWVYSNGPSAEIYFFMRRNGETGYFSYVDAVGTNETNKWVYIEKEFLVPSDVTQLNIRIDNNGGGTVWFDDIRVHPSNALMTTFTYKPLIGITSVTDVNNRIQYYYYDSFGRLVLIKDQDNKVLKQVCYNYAGQVEDCSINVSAQWQSTGVTRCKPCPTNSNYVTNILQNEQRDSNPLSATYGQTQWIDAGINSTCVITADWQNTATSTRCKSGSTTGEIEQEQKDMNPCSGSYNQVRWIVVSTNCSTCPVPANWQNTASATRCKSGSTTGEIEQEQRDVNTCSPSYNQTRWVVVSTNCSTCPVPANWQNTASATRCKSGSTTGEIEQEQRDVNTCSPSYNQTRWVVVSTNCSTCPVPANWQNTASATRCKSGSTTGEIEQEQRDVNTCSPSYNQTRWVVVSTNCSTCPVPANWQNTASATRCKSGSTTGEIEQEQRDVNTCSPTYNQTRWVVVGTNTTSCPITYFNQHIYDAYYRQCNVGTPLPYWVQVPEGTYSSTISQQDANNQAQAYAQQQADLYGTCDVQQITVTVNPPYGTCYVVQLTNAQTYETYWCYGDQVQVPEGYYHISVMDASNCDYYNYRYLVVACQDDTPYFQHSVTMYNVHLYNYCSSIYIQ